MDDSGISNSPLTWIQIGMWFVLSHSIRWVLCDFLRLSETHRAIDGKNGEIFSWRSEWSYDELAANRDSEERGAASTARSGVSMTLYLNFQNYPGHRTAHPPMWLTDWHHSSPAINPLHPPLHSPHRKLDSLWSAWGRIHSIEYTFDCGNFAKTGPICKMF